MARRTSDSFLDASRNAAYSLLTFAQRSAHIRKTWAPKPSMVSPISSSPGSCLCAKNPVLPSKAVA